ncbi:ubiquitin ligase [Tritrichomonas foetus]|uniref:HECT-type E3 ubiquitin transferase n=1 Tax=Tritrichomonas foetus TaxID=1144522 RepID=A0A1J4J587_9EUKA|nr:ubiquitin ligase [Tritrichomonas foetus]|eukprot:OHS93857.1 ubiquitin ligase [Tritrichomonas foetus]
MANLSPQDLIKLYFRQLTVGCDCAACQNETCKTCDRFSYKFKDANDAAIEAIRLTLRHPANPKLCENIKYYEQEPETKKKIENFNEYIGKMIRRENFDKQKAFSAIQEIFQDSAGFPYVLMILSDHLNPRKTDLLLNEDVVCDIPLAMRHYRDELNLMDLSISFGNLVNDLIMNDPPNTAHHIRAIILLFCMDIYFENSDDFEFNLIPIINHIFSLPDWSKSYLISAMSLYPTLLSNLLAPSSRLIKHSIEKNPKINIYQENSIIKTAAKFINMIHDASLSSRQPIKTNKFYLPEIESVIDLKYEFVLFHHEKQGYLSYPCVPFRLKFHALSIYLNLVQNKCKKQNLKFQISVDRENLANQVIDIIRRADYQTLQAPIYVIFRGESGIDLGGLTREFFYLAITQLFSPMYSLFKIVNDKFYWFTDTCFPEDLVHYQTLGTLVGLAVFHRITLPIRFPNLMYKKILGRPLSIVDVGELDQSIANSLTQLIDYKNNGNNIEEMEITFSITTDQFDNKVVVPFFEGGDSIVVTNDTLDRYIQYYIDFKLVNSVAVQFSQFVSGFRKLCSNQIFSCFTPEELDILVSGQPVFEWEALRNGARYSGYSANSQTIKWFWSCFDNLEEEDKIKFLIFTTGNSRAPVGGLSEVHLKIVESILVDQPPRSHTCFHSLELPHYSSKEKMRECLEVSLQNCLGFGFA